MTHIYAFIYICKNIHLNGFHLCLLPLALAALQAPSMFDIFHTTLHIFLCQWAFLMLLMRHHHHHFQPHGNCWISCCNKDICLPSCNLCIGITGNVYFLVPLSFRTIYSHVSILVYLCCCTKLQTCLCQYFFIFYSDMHWKKLLQR